MLLHKTCYVLVPWLSTTVLFPFYNGICNSRTIAIIKMGCAHTMEHPVNNNLVLFTTHYFTKGQLISKCLFGIINSPKKWTKKFDFPDVKSISKLTNLKIRLKKLYTFSVFFVFIQLYKCKFCCLVFEFLWN